MEKMKTRIQIKNFQMKFIQIIIFFLMKRLIFNFQFLKKFQHFLKWNDSEKFYENGIASLKFKYSKI